MNVYSVVRGQYMKKSLESLRDYVRASSGSKRSTASPSVLRKVTSPIVASEGTPTTSQKKYVKSISKKVSSVTSKLESAISAATIDKTKWKSSPILYEWWDTPERFKRRELDSKECDIINVSFTFLIAKSIGNFII